MCLLKPLVSAISILCQEEEKKNKNQHKLLSTFMVKNYITHNPTNHYHGNRSDLKSTLVTVSSVSDWWICFRDPNLARFERDLTTLEFRNPVWRQRQKIEIYSKENAISVCVKDVKILDTRNVYTTIDLRFSCMLRKCSQKFLYDT